MLGPKSIYAYEVLSAVAGKKQIITSIAVTIIIAITSSLHFLTPHLYIVRYYSSR